MSTEHNLSGAGKPEIKEVNFLYSKTTTFHFVMGINKTTNQKFLSGLYHEFTKANSRKNYLNQKYSDCNFHIEQIDISALNLYLAIRDKATTTIHKI